MPELQMPELRIPELTMKDERSGAASFGIGDSALACQSASAYSPKGDETRFNERRRDQEKEKMKNWVKQT